MKADEVTTREEAEALPAWEHAACRFCGLHHAPGTNCPPLEFPGTEWDQ